MAEIHLPPCHLNQAYHPLGATNEISSESSAALEIIPATMSVELQLHGDGDPDLESSTFSCGTVTGMWAFYGPGFKGWPTRVMGIFYLHNALPQNGQFALVLRQLIAYCQDHACDLAAVDVVNTKLADHLIKEWGFQPLPDSGNLVRRCSSGAF